MSTKGMRPEQPGEILREDYLADLGMSASALARALAVAVPRFNDLLRERRGISADTALRLARFFKTTPEFWRNFGHAAEQARPYRARGWREPARNDKAVERSSLR